VANNQGLRALLSQASSHPSRSFVSIDAGAPTDAPIILTANLLQLLTILLLGLSFALHTLQIAGAPIRAMAAPTWLIGIEGDGAGLPGRLSSPMDFLIQFDH
jgi:hypothetical protein